MRGSRVLTGAVAGLAMATVMAAPATADDNDAVFIHVLDQQGIAYPSVADAVHAANAVCAYLDHGNTLTEATTELADQTGLDIGEAGFFVGAATVSYCPQYRP